MIRAILLLSPLLFFASCASRPQGPLTPVEQSAVLQGAPGTWKRVGRLESPELVEASGLVASLQNPGIFWAINDSGAPSYLYAMDRRGAHRGEIRVIANNIDWEDLGAAVIDGRSYLVVADTGDNLKKRLSGQLYLVSEPRLEADGHVRFRDVDAETVRVRFEGGSIDVEAVAVSAKTNELLCLAKDKASTGLYVTSLRRNIGMLTAVRVTNLRAAVGTVEGAIQTTLKRGMFGDQATALDVSPDSLTAVVLTYADCLIYRRRPGESWAVAFQRRPKRVPLPSQLRQPEALCFHRNGKAVMVTSEGARSPVFEYWLP